MRNAVPVLSLLETRVLGTLVEKAHTVPDTYPLSLNALVAGCNQKTSRDPVIEATEAGDRAALPELLDVLRHPYTEQAGKERFAAKRPAWARHKPGCSMLSCSS